MEGWMNLYQWRRGEGILKIASFAIPGFLGYKQKAGTASGKMVDWWWLVMLGQ